SFVANPNPTDPAVKFGTQDNGYHLALTSDAAVLTLGQGTASSPSSTLSMGFVGANPDTQLVGLDPVPGRPVYFAGITPIELHTPPPNFGTVEYQNVFPGVNLDFYSTPQGQLEHTWQLNAGADPSAIQVDFQGATQIRLDAQGNLHLAAAQGDV